MMTRPDVTRKKKQEYVIASVKPVEHKHQHLPPTNNTKALHTLQFSFDHIDRIQLEYLLYGSETPYGESIISKQPIFRVQINSAKNKNSIIDIINDSGLNAIAERLLYLDKLPVSDPDDRSIALESLRGFASFIVDRPRFPKPRISISPDGLVNAEWDKDHDTLAMEFSEANGVRFAAIFYSESAPQHTSGILSTDNMTAINKSLIERFGLQ